MKYDIVSMSIPGNKPGSTRPENNDVVLDRTFSPYPTEPIYQARIIGVADGAGGMQPAGYAARYLVNQHLAVDPIFDPSAKDLRYSLDTYLRHLHRSFKEEHAGAEDWLRNSVSTIGLALLHDDYADCFWAGDSPIFITRFAKRGKKAKKEKPLTELVSTRDFLRSQPGQSVNTLTEGFGGVPEFEPYSKRLRLNVGDILTICTDGLMRRDDSYVLDFIYGHYNFEGVLEYLKEKRLRPPLNRDDASIIAAKIIE